MMAMKEYCQGARSAVDGHLRRPSRGTTTASSESVVVRRTIYRLRSCQTPLVLFLSGGRSRTERVPSPEPEQFSILGVNNGVLSQGGTQPIGGLECLRYISSRKRFAVTCRIFSSPCLLASHCIITLPLPCD